MSDEGGLDDSAIDAAAFEKKTAQLEAKLKHKEQQLDHAQAQCRQLTQDKDELITSTESLEQQLGALNQKEMKMDAKHRREVDRLTMDLDSERSRAAVLEDDLTSAKTAITSLKVEIREVQEKAEESLYAAKNALNNDQDAGDSEELRQSLEVMQMENKQLHMDAREKDDKLAHAKKLAAEAAEERTKAIQALVEKTETVNQLNAELDDMEHRMRETENENEDLKDELSSFQQGGRRRMQNSDSDDDRQNVPGLGLTLTSDYEKRLGRDRAISKTANSFALRHDGEETPRHTAINLNELNSTVERGPRHTRQLSVEDGTSPHVETKYQMMEESTEHVDSNGRSKSPSNGNEGSDAPKVRKKESGCPCVVQ